MKAVKLSEAIGTDERNRVERFSEAELKNRPILFSGSRRATRRRTH